MMKIKQKRKYKERLQLLDCAESSTSKPLCASSSTLVNWERVGKTGEAFERSGVGGPMELPTAFRRGPDGKDAVLL